MAKDAQEEFLGGGGLSLKFNEIGDAYTLKITEAPDVVQMRDYDTDEPLTWPDGRPRNQMVVYGQLTKDSDGWTDDEEDTGERRLFVKGYMTGALKDALRKAKCKRITPGGELYVEFTEEGEPKSRKHKPPKFFEMEWVADKYDVDETNEFEVDDEEEERPAPRQRRSARVDPEKKAPQSRGRRTTKDADDTVTGRAARRSRAAKAVESDDDDEAPF